MGPLFLGFNMKLIFILFQASRRYKVPSRTLYDKIKKMGISTAPKRIKKEDTTDIVDPGHEPNIHLIEQFAKSRIASENLQGTVHEQNNCQSKQDLVDSSESVPGTSPREKEDTPPFDNDHSKTSQQKIFNDDPTTPLDLTDSEITITRPEYDERA